MREQTVYLDSSAIVKRYIKEPGSDLVRGFYLGAYSGDTKLAYSIWNIGEVLGVIDKARQTDRLDESSSKIIRDRFLNETKRMARLGLAIVVPMKTRILVEAWKLIESHHAYQADTLQIATAKHLNAGKFLTADRTLYEMAQNENLSSLYLQ